MAVVRRDDFDPGAGGGTATALVRIAENVVTVATDTITFSSLNGDVDLIYQLEGRIVAGNAATTVYQVRPNADATAGNYGQQRLFAQGGTIIGDQTAESPGGFRASASLDATHRNHFIGWIHPVTGQVRLGYFLNYRRSTGVTVSTLMYTGGVWNNTADNITSLVCFANQSAGFGVGTRISLYALRTVSTP